MTMRLRHILASLCLALGLGACSPTDLFGGDFIDLPFGLPGLEQSELDHDALEPVMNAVNRRFRGYSELRDRLPFETLSTPGCLSDVAQGLLSVSFTLDVGCAFPNASGSISVQQEDVSSSETTITRMELGYHEVQIDEFEVDGREVILDTDPANNGSSKRELDLIQNGELFQYEFRLGMLDEEQLALDYIFNLNEGMLPVRLLLPPSSPGSLGTLLLTALDGVLVCELRNVPETSVAKGSCENGVTFGLPQP